MAKNDISVTNADAKKKPRGKPFEKGNSVGKQFAPNDPRRNNAGQRSVEVVAFGKSLRELIVSVGEEVTTLENGNKISKIEGVVRAAYRQAIAGDANARTFIAERVEGKAAQQIDLTNSDGSMAPQAVMFIPYDRTDTDNS